MCKTDKENYEKYWDDISPFIKFGCLKDEKFCDKINDYILFKDINDKYQTLPELLAPVADDGKTDAESADASDDTKKAENTDANADSSANTDENKEPEKKYSLLCHRCSTAGSVYQAVQGAGHETLLFLTTISIPHSSHSLSREMTTTSS